MIHAPLSPQHQPQILQFNDATASSNKTKKKKKRNSSLNLSSDMYTIQQTNCVAICEKAEQIIVIPNNNITIDETTTKMMIWIEK